MVGPLCFLLNVPDMVSAGTWLGYFCVMERAGGGEPGERWEGDTSIPRYLVDVLNMGSVANMRTQRNLELRCVESECTTQYTA